MSGTRRALLTAVAPEEKLQKKPTKITVVGCGAVGMACVTSMLQKGLCSEMCLVDANENVAHGEALDLRHGSIFLNSPHISYSGSYEITANSSIIVVTAGCRQKEGESRIDLVQRNADIFKSIIPPLAKGSPEAIIIVVSNPCDILAFLTLKISGFPPSRVIGSGTTLDSARFRYLISERLQMSPSSVHAYIIGEHGDTSVPVWSGINISGVRLCDMNPQIGQPGDPENWIRCHEEVVTGAMDIIKLKGYTSWGIGLSVAKIAQAIVHNTYEVLPVSTYIKGCKHGVDKEVFLSLPCVVAGGGVMYIVKQALLPSEKTKLQESANAMHDVQKGIKL